MLLSIGLLALLSAHAAPPSTLQAWVAEGQGLGLVVHREMAGGPVCRPGGEIRAFQDGASPAPVRHCTVVMGRPGFSRLFQLSVMTFEGEAALEPVVARKERCIDGCDPTQGYGKALRAGWVRGREAWWLTTCAGPSPRPTTGCWPSGRTPGAEGTRSASRPPRAS